MVWEAALFASEAVVATVGVFRSRGGSRIVAANGGVGGHRRSDVAHETGGGAAVASGGHRGADCGIHDRHQ